MFLTIVIVCAIYSLCMTPIERAIRKQKINKWLTLFLNFIISMAIFLLLYGIAAMCGYSIWD